MKVEGEAEDIRETLKRRKRGEGKGMLTRLINRSEECIVRLTFLPLFFDITTPLRFFFPPPVFNFRLSLFCYKNGPLMVLFWLKIIDFKKFPIDCGWSLPLIDQSKASDVAL